ncbi:MAG: hypothetical protein V1779_03775 [bacterium]
MKKIFYIIIVALILGFSYFFFFEEYIEYLIIKNSKDLTLISEYYKKYPNGFFKEDVEFIELSITNDIENARDFINKYKNSKYIDEVKKKYDLIWFKEIEKYIRHIKQTAGADPAAVKFFTALMYYLRDNYTKTVNLNLRGTVNLKEFKNYNKESQKVLLNDIKRTPDSAPLQPNLIALESVYKTGHIKNLEEIIRKAIKKSFENILSANFIQIVANDSSKNADLRIDIYYNIKNEESVIRNVKTPSLWEYWKYNKFIAYLMGIAIDFDFKFSIPGTKEVYQFHKESLPGDFIREIGDVRNGYVMMTKMSFERYAREIIGLFGLKKSYYQYYQLF